MIIAGSHGGKGPAREKVEPQVERLRSLLSFYGTAPAGEIKMEDFETYAIDRLRVLKEIEALKAKGAKIDQMNEKIKEEERKNLANDGDLGWSERLRKDHVSHYALRLAYCKTDDQRRWYVTHEAALFRHRFEHEKSEAAKQQFLSDNNITVAVVSKEDVSPEIKLGLEEMEAGAFRFGYAADGERIANSGKYIKLPFEDVIDSVKRRKAYLADGEAYVPYSELLTFVEPRFKMNLSRELTRCSKVIHLVEQDSRLTPLLNHLREQYLAFGDFKTEGVGITGTLSLQNLEQAYKQAMPPCMMQMRERLKTHHHLKYEGRKQLGAFLKRAGLSVEDSLSFWKSSFLGSHVSPDKFDKEYAYAVRYLYGKEGNGHGFRPFSCVRMIMSEPPNERDGKVHGCPFKTMNEDQIAAMLRRLGVTGTNLRESAQLAKDEHFQIACQKSFNGRYNVEDEDVITNPNDYFDKAMALAEQAAHTAANGGAEAAAGLTAEQRTQMARNKAAALAKAKAKQQQTAAGDGAQKGDPSAGMGAVLNQQQAAQ